MNILDKNIEAKFTIKKSKFLCFGFIVKNKDEVRDIIDGIKKKYPNASHICYAYILSDEVYYHTDGGEPSGTAGLPIYNSIKYLDLNYCLFVVVRYFGGIKFGTGPLRATFKEISLKTLKQAKISPYIISDVVSVKIPYDKLTVVSKVMRPYIKSKSFGKEKVTLELVGKRDELIGKIKKFKISEIKVEKNRIIK